MSESIGVFRKCVRCGVYRSIDEFSELGHMCTPCMRGQSAYRSVGSFAPSRGIVLTPKGHAAIQEVPPAA